MAARTLDIHAPAQIATRVPGLEPRSGEVCLVSTTEHRHYTNPVAIYSTYAVNEVQDLLLTIDDRVTGEALHAVGYLAFDAAPAFDPALHAHAGSPEPILWFGLYQGYKTDLPDPVADKFETPDWTPSITKPQFDSTITKIRDYIQAGDTYQVNYTFPMHANFHGDIYAWFRQLCDAQASDYSAFINTGDHIIVSASPELFFKLDGQQLTTKPMKGTIACGLTQSSDEAQRELLLASPKDRAENIMIVDLLRNDMGRISETGSVRVNSKFDVEKYDSLWQMTSSITSETSASIPEIFAALFPSGSVTGAPKIRTSEIIHELEHTPRGPYCGAVGYWSPNRNAVFNVAIRTAVLDIESEKLRYSVGAGITWDSSSDAEYAECLLKAEVVSQHRPSFELLESLLWDGDYFMLDRHLARLKSSADYFSYSFDEQHIRDALSQSVENARPTPLKVRLLLSRKGEITIDTAPIIDAPSPPRVQLALQPISSTNRFLYHKTTMRNVYTDALAAVDADDTILWNERGEITESTRANVVVRCDNTWYTPPVSSGLLAGTYREQLLEEGAIHEAVITKDDLESAQEIRLINSVRKWIPINFIQETATP
jgi:para-aminobenzoate synthetase/4-amino-4-deoxychorismate lyase